MTAPLLAPRPALDVLDALERAPAVARACAWAARGMVRSGRARAEAALAALKDARPDVRAAALVALAEVRRRGSDWQGQPGARAAALALYADGQVQRGALDEASGVLAALASDDAFDTRPAEALLSCARGHALDARQRMRGAPEQTGDRWSTWWLDLVRAEVLLEMGAQAGAEQALSRVAGSLPGAQRFGEAALRLAWLRTWSDVQGAWTRRKADAADTAASGAARASVTRLLRYAGAFPLYRALAEQLRGELALLDGADPSRAFAAAAAHAELANAPFSRARLVARQAMQVRAVQA